MKVVFKLTLVIRCAWSEGRLWAEYSATGAKKSALLHAARMSAEGSE